MTPAATTNTIMPRRVLFRHFQSRLLAIILILVMSLQALVFFTISDAANRNAILASEEALKLTALSLQTILNTRESNLRKYARLLASDFALKTLVSEGDQETILSAFQSYQQRLGADSMVLITPEGKILADTIGDDAARPALTQRGPTRPDYRGLIESARTSAKNESSGIILIGERAYQMVLVPLFAPQQIAWIGIGFAITDTLATELEQQTHTHVSLVMHGEQTAMRLLASTLSRPQRTDLHSPRESAKSYRMQLAGHEFVSLTLPLMRVGQVTVSAVLQRSLDEALAGFRALRWQLFGIFAFSTMIATLAGIVIARYVTRPLKRLAISAEQTRNGHYDILGDIGQGDEFGALALTFDNMVRGLMERDQVRSLLGKVVSPKVAEELLSRKIELGGEEREVSLLFSDIRGFTTLAEGRAPSDTLALLNTYLSHMSELVDQQQGVVDKYIGDAIMALFGAPIGGLDDPQRAVATALAMVQAMPELNHTFTTHGWPQLAIGIGVHTGIAVAGNVGSTSRLNYTVLGDSVNLAARLEGLCKKYQVTVIVSDATAKRCPLVAFRELDRVRVKGKREAVVIFEAIGYLEQIDQAQQQRLVAHHAALAQYRGGHFELAMHAFAALPQDEVTALYQGRCARFLQQPPEKDWDAIETLDEK
jgi:adenylate cyclase